MNKEYKEQIEKYQKLEQQLSQLQKENERLNDSINQSNLAKISALLKLEKLQQEKEAMKQLIEWIEECDFGFDNFVNDYEEDINMTEEEFDKETENMSYIESMIHYAKLYIKIKGE